MLGFAFYMHPMRKWGQHGTNNDTADCAAFDATLTCALKAQSATALTVVACRTTHAVMPLLKEMPAGPAGMRLTEKAVHITLFGVACGVYGTVGIFGAAIFGASTESNIMVRASAGYTSCRGLVMCFAQSPPRTRSADLGAMRRPLSLATRSSPFDEQFCAGPCAGERPASGPPHCHAGAVRLPPSVPVLRHGHHTLRAAGVARPAGGACGPACVQAWAWA